MAKLSKFQYKYPLVVPEKLWEEVGYRLWFFAQIEEWLKNNEERLKKAQRPITEKAFKDKVPYWFTGFQVEEATAYTDGPIAGDERGDEYEVVIDIILSDKADPASMVNIYIRGIRYTPFDEDSPDEFVDLKGEIASTTPLYDAETGREFPILQKLEAGLVRFLGTPDFEIG